MILKDISNSLNEAVNNLPLFYKVLVNLFLYVCFIVFYAIFIWKFYKFLSKREIISINTKQYDYSEHPSLEKIFAILFYTFEYMVILPFLILFWFAILFLFLLILSGSQTSEQILMISATIIVSTRIIAYLNDELSKNFAIIFPFGILAVFIFDPYFFNFELLLEKINQIPSLLKQAFIFLIFIFAIELILRIIYSISQLYKAVDKAIKGEGKDEENAESSVQKKIRIKKLKEFR